MATTPTHDDDHSENGAMEEIEEHIEEFLEKTMQAVELHIKSDNSNGQYERKVEILGELTELRSQLNAMSESILKISESVSLVPLKFLDESLKGFARTRTFRSMAEAIGDISEQVNELEDKWNDLPAPAGEVKKGGVEKLEVPLAEKQKEMRMVRRC